MRKKSQANFSFYVKLDFSILMFPELNHLILNMYLTVT